MTAIRIGAAAAMALALTACATTGPRSHADKAAAYFAQDFTCHPQNAKTVGLTTISAVPARYAGKCVQVSGFAKQNHLYRDGRDAADPARHPGLALIWHDKTIEHRLQLGPSFVTVTARVRSCESRKTMAAATPTHTEIDKQACTTGSVVLTVSDAKIIPTAMD
jgi:cytochrome c551/c552